MKTFATSITIEAATAYDNFLIRPNRLALRC